MTREEAHALLDTRVMSTEVVFSAAEDKLEVLRGALDGLGLASEQHGETFALSFDGDDKTDAVVDVLRAHDAHVISVTPRKESLEDVVVRRAQAPSDTDDAAKDEAKAKDEPKDEAKAKDEAKDEPKDEPS